MTDMKLKTRYGELSFDSSQVITFPHGIPGFEQYRKWKLFHEIDESGNWRNSVVLYLQSLDDTAVLLPLTDPVLFGFNFNLALSDTEAIELQLDDPCDVLVLTTLSLGYPEAVNSQPQPVSAMYVNISAPILINTKACIGMQKIAIVRESGIDSTKNPAATCN